MFHFSDLLPEFILNLPGAEAGDLLWSWIIITLAAALLCFLVSEITRNYSQVDKLWSLTPIVYCLITALAYPSSPRLWIMTALVAFWGLRLSYNFARKGGYKLIPWQGEEDYRWGFLREHKLLNKRWKFTLFNLFFISLYQLFLIMLFTTPILLAAANADSPLSWLDFIAGAFMLFFIVLELIADNQQFRFQQLKKGEISREGIYSASLDQGFLSEGIWKYARHPNFTGEQGTWVAFYFFGVAASGQWLNLTGAGAVLLILLFMGSSRLTEHLSKQKYPEYGEYQKRVARFVPFVGFR